VNGLTISIASLRWKGVVLRSALKLVLRQQLHREERSQFAVHQQKEGLLRLMKKSLPLRQDHVPLQGFAPSLASALLEWQMARIRKTLKRR
jgi:hypothetical protein